MTAGLQLPVIPFKEVPGRVKVVPAQTGPTGPNVGTVAGVYITMVILAVVAHCPASGAKV